MIPIVLTHGGRSVVYGSLYAVSAVVHGLVYVAGAAQDSHAVVAVDEVAQFQVLRSRMAVDIKQKVTCSEEVPHLQRAERST
jgi:hypothetical protein